MRDNVESRLYELKALKKQWKKLRSKKTLLWRILSIILLVLLILAGAVYALERLPQTPVTPYWDRIVGLLPFDLAGLANAYALPAMLALGALTLCCIIPWCCAGAKTKRSREYLSYRTLKNTLKAEKEEHS